MNSLDINSLESSILQEAMTTPSIALMKLSLEIDRRLRIVLASVGLLGRYSGPNPVDALDILSKNLGAKIPSSLRAALSDFWQLRNLVVHGRGNEEGSALRAIDYGLRILRIIDGIPRPHYFVRFAGIPLYRDAECKVQYEYGMGVIIQSYSGEGVDFGLHIHPSTLTYEPGQEVTWEWRIGQGVLQWEDAWYKNPAKDRAIEQAWSGSLEFRGRPIELV